MTATMMKRVASQVVRFPGRPTTIKLTDSPRTIAFLQSELLTCGMHYTQVAHKTGLGISTVQNIAVGYTKWPRLETVARILIALGWELVAQRR